MKKQDTMTRAERKAAARAEKKAARMEEGMGEPKGTASDLALEANETKTARASKPKPSPRECACGCGEMTRGGLFGSGHDGRVHGWFAMVREGAILAAGLRTPELQTAYAKWDGNGGLKAAFGIDA